MSSQQPDAAQRLREEKQIARMILEIEHLRNEASIAAEKEAGYKKLVELYDERLSKMRALADDYKAASESRADELAKKEEIIATHKKALQDADKLIERLKRSNSRLKKVALIGLVLGFLGGLFARGQ